MKSKINVFLRVGLILLALCFLLAPNLQASMGPLETLENNVTHVLDVLKSPELGTSDADEKDLKVLKEVAFMFDFTAFSRGALGAKWRRFSPEQQVEFTELFTRIVARSYLAKLASQNIDDFEIMYLQSHNLKATKSGTKRSDVFTMVKYNGNRTPVDYRMFYKNNAWKIYDLRIEGVSMVANYRKQYQQRFMDSPEKLIKELQDKLQKNVN